jgi:hypothetical protein
MKLDDEFNNSKNYCDLVAKYDELSKNISFERAVVRENTRLPKEFVEEMIKFSSNQRKKKLFESYENSDLVKLIKEVKNLIFFYIIYYLS